MPCTRHSLSYTSLYKRDGDATMPIDFRAFDALTSDENVATFPSTITTQSVSPTLAAHGYDAFLLKEDDYK